MYLIVSGRVHIQNIQPSGEIVHIVTRSDNELFGEMAVLDGKPRMADAVTAEPCDLLMLNQGDFLHCLKSNPQISLNIIIMLIERLREAAEDREVHQELDVQGRIAQIILDQPSEPHESGGKILTVKLTQQEIAEIVGAKRESVNRVLSSFKKTRVLTMDGRWIVILREDRLRRYCTR